jgi:hypothetical protein
MCAVCLVHEADLKDYGAEGFGLTAVEHYDPRSRRTDLANTYDNCLYICRLCNTARSNRPIVDALGRRILNITIDVWADHFRLDGIRLVPRDGDVDAQYTSEAYDLDDPRKIVMRSNRQEAISLALDLVMRAEAAMASLTDFARQDVLSGDIAQIARGAEELDAAAALHVAILNACRTLARWEAVPTDASTACRCAHTVDPALPGPINEQLLVVDCRGGR